MSEIPKTSIYDKLREPIPPTSVNATAPVSTAVPPDSPIPTFEDWVEFNPTELRRKYGYAIDVLVPNAVWDKYTREHFPEGPTIEVNKERGLEYFTISPLMKEVELALHHGIEQLLNRQATNNQVLSRNISDRTGIERNQTGPVYVRITPDAEVNWKSSPNTNADWYVYSNYGKDGKRIVPLVIGETKRSAVFCTQPVEKYSRSGADPSIRAARQVVRYASLLAKKCQFGFIITEKEVMVMNIDWNEGNADSGTATEELRSGTTGSDRELRPKKTRPGPLKPIVKWKSIPLNSDKNKGSEELTVKLALFYLCLMPVVDPLSVPSLTPPRDGPGKAPSQTTRSKTAASSTPAASAAPAAPAASATSGTSAGSGASGSAPPKAKGGHQRLAARPKDNPPK
ncbi:hypothetical protein F4779DRAFT_602759 [Xylariaceae sp. FL0662B]|nr:hypothetical protein F4779DRAFT_602759 [Xylariaceae sp. FL0662B]